MQREGIFREMKLRGHYEKPSEKKAREKAEAIRRARKLARKRAQREGLLPGKPKPAMGAGRPGGPGGKTARAVVSGRPAISSTPVSWFRNSLRHLPRVLERISEPNGTGTLSFL